jgi:histone deacetylase complex regulatory component SIN3
VGLPYDSVINMLATTRPLTLTFASLPHVGDAEQLLVELSSPRESDCPDESGEGAVTNYHGDQPRHGDEVHGLTPSRPLQQQQEEEQQQQKEEEDDDEEEERGKEEDGSRSASPPKSEDEVTPVNRSPASQFTARLLLPSSHNPLCNQLDKPHRAGVKFVPVATTKRRRAMPASLGESLSQQLAQQDRTATAENRVENHGSCSTAATPAVQYTMQSSTVRYYFPEEVPVAGLFSRASGFVDKVKSAYISCPWVFEEFLRILTDFQLERVSRATVLNQVAELFKSNDGNASGADLFAEFANFSTAPMEPNGANGHAACTVTHGACTV